MTTQTYYPNHFLERLITHLGLQAYYDLLQKIDETQLILDLAIEKLEEYNKQLKQVATATKPEKKQPKKTN